MPILSAAPTILTLFLNSSIFVILIWVGVPNFVHLNRTKQKTICLKTIPEL